MFRHIRLFNNFLGLAVDPLSLFISGMGRCFYLNKLFQDFSNNILMSMTTFQVVPEELVYLCEGVLQQVRTHSLQVPP